MTPTAPRMVTIAEAAVEVGVSRRTIYHWLATGKIAWRRTVGGSVRIVAARLWQHEPGAAVAAPTPRQDDHEKATW